MTERIPEPGPINTGFACNRIGPHHRFGTTECPACEPFKDRDARFAPGNDALWGEGNWVRCPTCPPDGVGRQPYHHKDAHG